MKLRTDLAIECREMLAKEIAGIEQTNHGDEIVDVTHVKILTNEAAQKIGKPIGNYITIEIKDMMSDDQDIVMRSAEAVRSELGKIINIAPDAPVLVVGLGNRYITPDSIGPKTVQRLLITRHLTEKTEKTPSVDIRPVSAVSPGVLALTGIETSEITEAVSKRIKPSLIIAVDALASRSLSRLGTTIQIADTGISPGSGVGNHRNALDEETLGVPVIAIGIPMVVDAFTMIADTLSSFKENTESEEKDDDSAFIQEFLKTDKNMIVTPNDVDILSERASEIIAEGINRALLIK